MERGRVVVERLEVREMVLGIDVNDDVNDLRSDLYEVINSLIDDEINGEAAKADTQTTFEFIFVSVFPLCSTAFTTGLDRYLLFIAFVLLLLVFWGFCIWLMG